MRDPKPSHFRVIAHTITDAERQDWRLPQEVTQAFWWARCTADGTATELHRQPGGQEAILTAGLGAIRAWFGADRIRPTREDAARHAARWSDLPEWTDGPQEAPAPRWRVIVLPADLPVPVALRNGARLIIQSTVAADGTTHRLEKSNGSTTVGLMTAVDALVQEVSDAR